MSFKYRTKDYKNEEGEYSEYLPCDKETILELISFNWTDNRPNGLHVISILNENGESLLLEHFGKDVFDVYFLPKKSSFHFHKKSKQELIYNCVEFFMGNKISDLEQNLNKTSKDNDFIRDEFFFIDHDYKITDKRATKELWWLLFAVPYGIIMTVFALFMFVKLPLTLFPLPLIFFAIGTHIWLPGLLLHFHYKRDGNWYSVQITKGSDSITLRTNQITKVLSKTNIETVTKFQNPAYKLPWSDYGYTEIKFKTGEIINLTNLMLDQFLTLDKFSRDKINPKVVNKAIPRLRYETSF
jgi:hypothetical protein